MDVDSCFSCNLCTDSKHLSAPGLYESQHYGCRTQKKKCRLREAALTLLSCSSTGSRDCRHSVHHARLLATTCHPGQVLTMTRTQVLRLAQQQREHDIMRGI